jgi:hypothetical protein
MLRAGEGPRSYLKRSRSKLCGEMVVQLIRTNGPFPRALFMVNDSSQKFLSRSSFPHQQDGRLRILRHVANLRHESDQSLVIGFILGYVPYLTA